MKLSQILFRRNLLPNGHLFRGKDRLVKPVLPKHLRKIRNDFEVEEKNMFFLRFPYLTEAESAGHARALGRPDKRMASLQDQTRRMFKNDVTLYERLGHLRVTEGWD